MKKKNSVIILISLKNVYFFISISFSNSKEVDKGGRSIFLSADSLHGMMKRKYRNKFEKSFVKKDLIKRTRQGTFWRMTY